MKHLAAFIICIAVFAFSCSDNLNAPVAGTGAPKNPSLGKCSSCGIQIKLTSYYRSTDSTWCVGMRIFRNDGSSLPLYGGYVWYRDTTPCDSLNNWDYYADSVKCITVSGLNNANLSGSRFAFKATYGGYETPRIIIGRNLTGTVTGCLADPCGAADSTFVISYLTCDSLYVR